MDITAGFDQVSGESGNSMKLYTVAPATDGKKPGLLVIMEVFGVNTHIQEVTQRFAREGYVAIAPDLYYRLDKRITEDLQEAFAMRATLYEPKIVEDLNRVIIHLQRRADVNPQKIGIIGYCFGGRVSWLAACQCSALSAAAVYYGGGIVGGERGEKSPVEPVAFANNIKIPMHCVWGDEDELIPQDARHEIERALKSNKVNYEWHVYKGAGHAFFADNQPSYCEAAAADVWPKTLAFLARHLKH
jgi:carboxymethylenebutenolidase